VIVHYSLTHPSGAGSMIDQSEGTVVVCCDHIFAPLYTGKQNGVVQQ